MESVSIKDNIKTILSGSMAGVSQALVGHPLDTVKVRMVNGRQNSILGCCRMMMKDNGFRSFYQGIRAPLYGSVFQNALLFNAYETSRKVIGIKDDDKKDINHYKKVVAATALASVPMSFYESPMELFKCQMQVNKGSTFKSVYRDIGRDKSIIIRRGLHMTMARNIIGYPLYFVPFEIVRDKFADNLMLGSFLGGAAAGFCTWAIPYPIDYYKTCIQSDSLDPKKRKYKGIIDVVKRSSLRDCYRGFLPCVLRAVPVNAVIFLVYSKVKSMIE